MCINVPILAMDPSSQFQPALILKRIKDNFVPATAVKIESGIEKRPHKFLNWGKGCKMYAVLDTVYPHCLLSWRKASSEAVSHLWGSLSIRILLMGLILFQCGNHMWIGFKTNAPGLPSRNKRIHVTGLPQLVTPHPLSWAWATLRCRGWSNCSLKSCNI